MKKLLLLSLVTIIVCGLIITGCAEEAPAPAPSPEPAEPVVLKGTTFLPPMALPVLTLRKIAEKVPAMSNGELIIDILGGPEVMPPPAFAEGLEKGIIDIACLPCEMYDGIVPLGYALALSELTDDEEYVSGAYDVMNELHMEQGLFLLSRGVVYAEPHCFNFQTNVRIEKLADLRGKKIMVSSSMIPAQLAYWGATEVVIPNAEFYTSMERGVVDGFIEPLTASIPRGMQEVTKYIIDPAFGRGGVVVTMGLGSWNKLPSHLQQVLIDAAKEARDEFEVEIEVQMAQQRQIALDGGMEVVTMSPAEADQLFKDFYAISWQAYEEQHPEVTAMLEPLMTK